MAISSHEVVLGSISGTRQNVTYIYTAPDGGQIILSYLLPIGTDFNADALSRYDEINAQFESDELSIAFNKIENREDPDKVPPIHMTQVDFDRRVMGYIMTVEDCHKLNACLPFWQALQPRNGNNRAQRIATLGVPANEYDEFADRLNAYFGVAVFLDTDLVAIWDEIKEAWQ